MSISKVLVRLSPAVILLPAVWFCWWCFGRSPQDQVMAAQTRFLHLVEKRDFSAMKNMLADDYKDDYGLDKEQLTATAKNLIGGFFTLTIHQEPDRLQAVPDLAMVKLKLRLEGSGTGISQIVLSRANQVTDPWFFHWHKRGIWPWSWKIVQIHNEQLP